MMWSREPITAACAVRVQVGYVCGEAESVGSLFDCESEGGADSALGVPVVGGGTLEKVVFPIEGWLWGWI